jgi:hypothetical protein
VAARASEVDGVPHATVAHERHGGAGILDADTG